MNKGLPPGWRVVDLSPDSPKIAEHVKYVKSVAAQIAAIPRIKTEVPKTWNGKPTEELTQGEREEFYLSMQQESTQKAIIAQRGRNEDEDLDHLFRPLPAELEWKREVEHRAISPEEFMVAKSNQRAAKNTLGQSEDGSVDSAKRKRGIEAFTYSEPAKLTPDQIKRLTKLEEIVNTPLLPPKPTEKWWKRIFNRTDDTRPWTDDEWNEYIGKN